jgi:hypothetical protein
MQMCWYEQRKVSRTSPPNKRFSRRKLCPIYILSQYGDCTLSEQHSSVARNTSTRTSMSHATDRLCLAVWRCKLTGICSSDACANGLTLGERQTPWAYVRHLLVHGLGRAERSTVEGLQPLACWGSGLESYWGHGCLSWMLCVVTQRSLRRADPSFRAVLPTVVCHCVWRGNFKNEAAMARAGLLRQMMMMMMTRK